MPHPDWYAENAEIERDLATLADIATIVGHVEGAAIESRDAESERIFSLAVRATNCALDEGRMEPDEAAELIEWVRANTTLDAIRRAHGRAIKPA